MATKEGTIKRKSRLAVFENVLGKRTSRSFTNDDLSVCSDDLIIDDEFETRPKKQKKFVRLKEEPLMLKCIWGDCEEKFNEHVQFDKHLIEHVENFYVSNQEALFTCQFGQCSFTTSRKDHAYQHASFHAYHEKLKNIGENVVVRDSLPECVQEDLFKITIEPNGYLCQWEYCFEMFVTICDFLEHMKIHAHNNPRVCKGKEKIECCWKGCVATFKDIYKLTEHMHVHTKEKLLACPTCGNMFASRTRFADHRKRQLPIEKQSYQCSQCSKLFPTEKLLRDHMRVHINQYKCTMCDMTCCSPSVLALHIRYRHLNDRPFKCNLCDHSSITKQNLELHLITHCAEKLLACDECGYQCRSMYGLDRHLQKKHGHSPIQTYECHVCKKTFNRGAILTKHLMKKHDFHWPSGHSRFRYKEDPDGIYRLQTVRYESLEVTEEILKSTANPQKKPDLEATKYVLKPKSSTGEKIISFEIAEACGDDRSSEDGKEVNGTAETNVNSNVEIHNNVLITISDIDDRGNILNSETIESQEIYCLKDLSPVDPN